MQQNHQPNHSTADHASDSQLPPNRLIHLEERLTEAFDELWSDFVDPADAFYDVDGARWNPLGVAPSSGSPAGAPFTNEQQLQEIRNHCRALATSNEFAINGHENRVTKTTFRIPGRLRAEHS